MGIPQLTRAAELRGVSGWVHPVLSFPWNPVVLVEGEIDARALSHVASVAGVSTVRFVPLPTLDPAQRGGGKDQIIKYLRANRSLIGNRPKSAPLVVLFDWEVSDSNLEQAREAYGVDGDRLVVRMDVEFCRAELGRTFKGIERFYPPRIIVEAHEADEMVVGIRPGKPYSVAAEELSKGKSRLLERLVRVDDLSELEPLVRTVVALANLVRGPASVQL